MDEILEKKLNEADSLLKKRKNLEAVFFLKEVVREFSDSSYAYYLLGISRMKCGLFALAKRSFETADKMKPNNAENMRNLGWVKYLLGKVDEGRDDLRSAINLDLANSRTYLDLATTYFNYLDFDEGFAWIERAKALDPKDKFILDNYEFAKETKESFFNLSEAERKKIKEENLIPEMQQQNHLQILKTAFGEKGFKEKEIMEFNEELKLSGLSKKIIVYKDKFKEETKEDIYKKRDEIEKSLLELIEKEGVELTIEEVKKIIYNEKGHNDIEKIVGKFDINKDIEEFKKIVYFINDVWNYFPHKSLKGLSPAEFLLKKK